jgi:hypothetical protein
VNADNYHKAWLVQTVLMPKGTEHNYVSVHPKPSNSEVLPGLISLGSVLVEAHSPTIPCYEPDRNDVHLEHEIRSCSSSQRFGTAGVDKDPSQQVHLPYDSLCHSGP